MKYQIIFNEHPYWERDPELTAAVQSAIIENIEKNLPVLQEGDIFQQTINNQSFSFISHLSSQESLVSGENYQVLDLELTEHPSK